MLGAGDAFMGGLITGRLEGKSWRDACAMANACGAFAVSRHACAPAYPSRLELDHFIAQGSLISDYVTIRRWNNCIGPPRDKDSGLKSSPLPLITVANLKNCAQTAQRFPPSSKYVQTPS